jgi:hypothetical protein
LPKGHIVVVVVVVVVGGAACIQFVFCMVGRIEHANALLTQFQKDDIYNNGIRE